VQPIADRASDRAPLHDRRPFIVGPTLLGILWLVGLWWAPSWLWLLLAYVLVQVCMNVAQAAFQALIPDLVKPAQRGVASGVKSAFDVLGTALGLIGVQLLLGLGLPTAGLYTFFALVLVVGPG
jgi:MFS-type transporter involved in bile tolerance (Atg22 family)